MEYTANISDPKVSHMEHRDP